MDRKKMRFNEAPLIPQKTASPQGFCLPHMEKIFQRFRGWEVYHGNLFPDLRHQYSTSASTSSPPIKTTRIFSLDSTTTHRRICRIT